MYIVQASDWLLDSHFCRLRLFTLLSEKKLLLFCTVCGKLTTHTQPFNDPLSGLFASLHVALDRQPLQHPTTQSFTGQMPFLMPNQQRQSTEAKALSRKLTNTDELLQMLNEHYKLWRNIFHVATNDKLRRSLSGQWFKLHAVIFVDHMCFVVQVK